MSRVGSKNTGPELLVRRLLRELGFRYRLHATELPGSPDIVNRSRRVAVFVHGCFWHAHGCTIGKPPKSRLEFWLPKLERNRVRDSEALHALKEGGWHVLVVWQCDTKNIPKLEIKLRRFLRTCRGRAVVPRASNIRCELATDSGGTARG